jgi:hypothetical protein
LITIFTRARTIFHIILDFVYQWYKWHSVAEQVGQIYQHLWQSSPLRQFSAQALTAILFSLVYNRVISWIFMLIHHCYLL